MKSGPLKWHGGKAYLANKIISLMPPHTRYGEPYFGGGSVLLQKPCEGIAEFANDIHTELTNFWRCLANERLFAEFVRIVQAVPLSRPEWESAARGDSGEGYGEGPVANAVAFFIHCRQSRQGLMRDFATPTSRTRRGMNENVSAWLSAVEGLPEIHSRLKRVEIRNDDAMVFIRELDSPDTLFYCDPPYLHETRASTGEYAHEMTPEQHAALLDLLASIKGKFLLSGYRSKLYDDFAERCQWRRVDIEIPNQASSAKVKERKTECVWMN